VRLFNLFHDATGGELPKNDSAIRASGYNDVLSRSLIELQAQDRRTMANERLMYQALGVEIPNPYGPVSAPTDKVFPGILNSVHAFRMSFVRVIGVRELEVCKSSSVPIVFESSLLLVQVLPIDLGFRAR
jgi:hypothetical protein